MNIIYSVAFGRFNPITKEHEKLLDQLNKKENNKFIFVFGKNEETLKLPDRVSYIKWLYPKIDVIPCTRKYCETPLQALSWLYHQMNRNDIHLDIHCGNGNNGIIGISNEGASYSSINSLIKRYNGKNFINSNEMRMNWKSIIYWINERGVCSASSVRKKAKELNFNNEEDVNEFMNYLHSRINFHESWRIMKLLKN